jgi:hypothetical protein
MMLGALVMARAAGGAGPGVAAKPYRPFIDPMNLHDQWWWTLLPLALFISMAYKAVRLEDLGRYWKQTGLMTVQVVAGMIGLAAAVYLVVELVLPRV